MFIYKKRYFNFPLLNRYKLIPFAFIPHFETVLSTAFLYFQGTSAEIAAGTARREAARKRLAAAKAALKKEQHSSITFDAGFFQVCLCFQLL